MTEKNVYATLKGPNEDSNGQFFKKTVTSPKGGIMREYKKETVFGIDLGILHTVAPISARKQHMILADYACHLKCKEKNSQERKKNRLVNFLVAPARFILTEHAIEYAYRCFVLKPQYNSKLARKDPNPLLLKDVLVRVYYGCCTRDDMCAKIAIIARRKIREKDEWKSVIQIEKLKDLDLWVRKRNALEL